MNDEFSWAVGVFEGEGYIISTGKNSIILGVEMADEDVIVRLHKVFGVGYVGPSRKRKAHYKLMYFWRSGQAAENLGLLKDMVPLLGKRRRALAEKAIECLPLVTHQDKEAKHGLSRYTSRKWKCRCAVCKKAMKDYKLEWQKRKRRK